MGVVWSVSLGGGKSSAIRTVGHSRPLAVWAVETVTSASLVGELVDRGEDGVGAVGVDEVDEGLQVAAGGVVFGVVLQLAPGGERRVRGGWWGGLFEVAGGEGEARRGFAVAGEGDAAAGRRAGA